MSVYLIRQAQASDAPAMIDYIKRIADEPDNGISLSSSSDYTETVDGLVERIQKTSLAEASIMILAFNGDELIGETNASNGRLGYRHTVSLGITVKKEWRGKGVGSAMMAFLIEWCQQNPLVHRLELQVFNNNPAGIRFYERLGFRHEGARIESYFKQGEFLDLIQMAILFTREPA